MSFNRSALAFEDIEEAFERALASAKGIRIPCINRGAAVTLRSRFNYFRWMNRRNSTQIYPQDHPMWNKSVYDKLILRLPPKGSDEEHILYVEPRSAYPLEIHEIV